MNNKNVVKIEFIQALRGIAALCVVLYHGSYWTGKWAETTKEIFFPAGYFGVAVFFVISGFIMVITTKKSDGSFNYVSTFAIKRFMRIWPAYFMATILTLLILDGGSWFTSKDNLIFFLRSMLFIPSGADYAPTFGTPAISVGWTLSYEVFFYAIFALSMFAGRARWIVFYAISAFLLIILPTVLTGWWNTDPKFDYGLMSLPLGLITSPIIWLFVAGVVIGQIYMSKIVIKNKKLCWIMVFAVVMFTISQYVSGSRVGHGIFDWGTSIIPLMLCLTIVSKTIDIKIPKYLVYLGDISFSLYLIHVLMQGLTLHALIYFNLAGFGHGISSIIMTTTASILAAAFFHKYIESFFSETITKSILLKINQAKASKKESTTVSI